jgi:hypothetical protein
MEREMNVFDKALQIIDEHGWHAGDWHGPRGERCLQQAWHEAREELDPLPRRRWWQRRLSWPVLAARRARADAEDAALRSAIEQVTGRRLWGCAAQWNDEDASEEDVRLALKIAAGRLGEPRQGLAEPAG